MFAPAPTAENPETASGNPEVLLRQRSKDVQESYPQVTLTATIAVTGLIGMYSNLQNTKRCVSLVLTQSGLCCKYVFFSNKSSVIPSTLDSKTTFYLMSLCFCTISKIVYITQCYRASHLYKMPSVNN